MPCCSIYAQNIVSLLNRDTLCKQVARINRSQLHPRPTCLSFRAMAYPAAPACGQSTGVPSGLTSGA